MSRWWRALRPTVPAPPDARPPDPERAGHGITVPVSLANRPSPHPVRHHLQLGKADQGRTVETTVGEEFLVRLPEDPATGYAWQFTGPVDRLLAVVGSTFEGAAPSRPGSGGHLAIRLRGRRQGTAALRLALTRLWGGEPVDSFEIAVRVVEQGDGPHGVPG